MFSNKPKDSVSAPTPLVMPAPVPAAPPRRAARSSAPSILSADTMVTGTLVSDGDMQIDGRVEGDVRSVSLVIGEKAEIHGEIHAEDVTVRGRVVGRIRARRVMLCATSHVEGDILHEAFAVESGAFFEGNCRHSDNPLGDAPVVTTQAPQQTVVTVAAVPRASAPVPGQATLAAAAP